MSSASPPPSSVPPPLRPGQRLRYYASRLRPHRLAATAAWGWGILRSIRHRRGERGGQRLTVAVDAAPLWGRLTGIGWYLQRVLEHLAHRDDLRLRLYGPRLAQIPNHEGSDGDGPAVPLPQGPAIEWVHVECPEELSLPPWRLAALVERVRPLLAAADANEVVFLPNFLVPGTLRLLRGPRVVTLHDLAFLLHPETLREETLEDLQLHLPRSLVRARRIVTPTATVAQEVRAAALAPAAEVQEILHGAGQLAAQPSSAPLPAVTEAPTATTATDATLGPGIPPRFALHVGTVEPRKNLGVVLDAWELLRRRGVNPPALVLVGGDGWKLSDLARRIEAGRDAGWLIRPGYVDNDRLAALYRAADLVVFPTLYEGFGLPAVEAQSAATPLVASDIPVLREVAGKGALFVPPNDPAAWADAVERLLSDPEEGERLVAAGSENTQRFSWHRSAAQHAEALLRLGRR